MKKRILALLLATTMICGLFTACGGNNNVENSEPVIGDISTEKNSEDVSTEQDSIDESTEVETSTEEQTKPLKVVKKKTITTEIDSKRAEEKTYNYEYDLNGLLLTYHFRRNHKRPLGFWL